VLAVPIRQYSLRHLRDLGREIRHFSRVPTGALLLGAIVKALLIALRPLLAFTILTSPSTAATTACTVPSLHPLVTRAHVVITRVTVLIVFFAIRLELDLTLLARRSDRPFAAIIWPR
jgi:hypothetical protein